MELNLSGKTVLVTGSSRGIGLAIAHSLHSEGCRIALNGRNEKDLAIASDRLPGAISILGDVTSSVEAKKIVQGVFLFMEVMP